MLVPEKQIVSLQLRIANEIKIQSGLLQRELRIWRERTADPNSGLGIHRSQVKAVGDFLFDLMIYQDESLANLEQSLTSPDFARKRREFESQLVGMHGLAAVFQHILMQREDHQIYRAVLDVADLIAADCYLPCIERAYKWGALSTEQFRVPPLTYFNSMASPAAFTRRHTFAAFKMPIEEFFSQKLPISVISLPFQYATSVWMLCTIFHEVGHLIDQDLGLHASLLSALEERLQKEGADDLRITHWRWWLRELIADTFGILLGDAAFMYTMIGMLLQPDDEVVAINTTDIHPNHYVRIYFLLALLRQVSQPTLSRTSWKRVEATVQQWRDLYNRSDSLMPYVDECAHVADVLLNTKLCVLKNHCIRELVSGIKGNQSQVNKLSDYFWIGYRQPKVELVRLVPAAAQMAIQKVEGEHEIYYAGIHDRAMKYFQSLEHPIFMAPLSGPNDYQQYWNAVTRDSPERRGYLRDLVRNLTFGKPTEM